jgi:alkanesulfonate monooxygenase SsuD/methylene tetrahydromethanopterin reductase-like flavin-dependent oxidoreductase (luciferase family)
VTEFNLSLDMRAPDFGTPPARLYSEVLEMAQFADAHGLDYISINEHHGTRDGYLPAPTVLAAALAARTKRIRIQIAAVILPLHDPVKIAEQIAVLDLVSQGRLEIVFGAGYVPFEFNMFRVSLHDRGRLLEEGIPIIQRALAGERFTAGGREVFVRPLPIQKPHPSFLHGGGVPATARRAARLGIGPYPLNPSIIPVYREECEKLGRPVGKIVQNACWIHVSEDPDKTWAQVGPHVGHVAKAYAELTEGAQSSSPFQNVDSLEALKAVGIYRVVTPDECVALAKEGEKEGYDYGLAPLIAGLDPEIGWKNLELFLHKVLPRLRGAKS